MNAALQEFQKFLDEKNLVYFTSKDENHIRIGFDNMEPAGDISIDLYFAETDVALIIRNLIRVPVRKKPAIVKTCSVLNEKFRWMTFFVEDNSMSVYVRTDVMIQPEGCAGQVFNLMVCLLNSAREAYSTFFDAINEQSSSPAESTAGDCTGPESAGEQADQASVSASAPEAGSGMSAGEARSGVSSQETVSGMSADEVGGCIFSGEDEGCIEECIGTSEDEDELPFLSDKNESGIQELTVKVQEMSRTLKESIFGQDEAIDNFCRGYYQSMLVSEEGSAKPKAVFLFVGPPGVGKTLVSKQAAHLTGRPCCVFNMTDYSDHQAPTDLCGVSKRYMQASPGRLTTYVEKHPNAILIFDEIERCHPKAKNLFLQILNDGVLLDNYTEKNVAFKDTIIFFTSNSGRSLYERKNGCSLSGLDRSVVLDALAKERPSAVSGPAFPTALLSRFAAENIVVFNQLSSEHLRRIVQMNLEKSSHLLAEKYDWNVSYDEALPDLFLFNRSAELDARIISNQSWSFLQEQVYEYCKKNVDQISLDNISQFEFRIHTEDGPAEIQNLFSSPEHLLESIKDFSGKGKRLSYDTVMRTSGQDNKAVIEFCNFEIKTAVKTGDQTFAVIGDQKPDVSFDDVIGSEHAKEELKYFAAILDNPKKHRYCQLTEPKGILLHGPAGCGKTMLARAMAGQAKATFFAADATDFMAMFIGEGEKRIRDLFQSARDNAPSVIFIDEIDAIGKVRTGENKTEPLLNTLMTEMSGFRCDPERPVFVIAATNFPIDQKGAGDIAVIDPALLRRFDNRIQVELPTKDERALFLKRMREKVDPCDLSDCVLENVAERTVGQSLALMQNIVNLALRKADRSGEALSDQILLDALDEYSHGRKHPWDESLFKGLACHEAGHALLAHLSGHTPAFATIVSRGNIGGYIQPSCEEDVPIFSKDDLIWRIRIALAGRASEVEILGGDAGINTGVSSDLQHATDLAIDMLCRYGMSDDGSLLSFNRSTVMQTAYGQHILEEANKILHRELKAATDLIREHRGELERLMQELLEKNQLTKEEIADCLDGADPDKKTA